MKREAACTLSTETTAETHQAQRVCHIRMAPPHPAASYLAEHQSKDFPQLIADHLNQAIHLCSPLEASGPGSGVHLLVDGLCPRGLALYYTIPASLPRTEKCHYGVTDGLRDQELTASGSSRSKPAVTAATCNEITPSPLRQQHRSAKPNALDIVRLRYCFVGWASAFYPLAFD